MTLIRPGKGRNLAGMLSHVFRPIITAFFEPVVGLLDVTLRKNAMSDFIGDQGRVPFRPMPRGGERAVATTRYIGLVVLGMVGWDVDGGGNLLSMSFVSISVGDGVSKVVSGGVDIVDIIQYNVVWDERDDGFCCVEDSFERVRHRVW